MIKIDSWNLYHRFEKGFIGIFAKETLEGDYSTGQMIQDVDLYYQPVQVPFLAAIFLGIKILILVIGQYLLVKVNVLMKKEKGLVKEITQLLVCAEMILWPTWVLFAASTDFIHPLNEVVGQWFCETGSFLYYFLALIMASNSFMAAVLRYLFIVQQDRVRAYGKEKIKRIVFILHILLPLILASWEVIDGAELDSMSFVNRCNGKHHKVFLLDTSTLNIAKRSFCGFEEWDSKRGWNQIFSILHFISCIANKIIMVIIGLNVFEGILYYQVITHMNR